MQRTYDLFERFEDKTVLWRGRVDGLENAIARLKDLAKDSANELFIFHSATRTTVARINVADDGPNPDGVLL